MKRSILILSLLCSHTFLISQVTLEANGPGDTYELITSVFAPGYDPVEAPDCSHTAFGRHIDEIFDAVLNKHVFRFFAHANIDNDRCINFDRQRNEIKTYDKSPDNLLGIDGEKVVYTWKFKLDANFQVSPKFTHLHQLKSVGGSLASMPMYTLTARKSSPDRLELRYAETDTQVTLLQKDLAPFKGTWLSVTETITYGTNGDYAIEISKVSDGTVLLSYSNNNIINWRPDAEFVRPKWGIYRSLNHVADLRDEEVLFADFSIEEVSALSLNDYNVYANKVTISPNPAKDSITISEIDSLKFDHILIYNPSGKKVASKKMSSERSINISSLTKGLYFLVFKKEAKIVSMNKLIVK
ncbi:MAG: T9SS type A sorting domain-containing protein [Flavobacteriaceae bacterium]